MTNISRFGTYNQVLPEKGPKAYPFKLDFRDTNLIEIDMSPEIVGGFISYISGCFVDNRLNANELEIEVASVGQLVGIPAGKQAYMPLLVTDAAQLTIRTISANDLVVPFFIVNFPVTPAVW
jgi:hypothetical protein